MSVTLKFSPDVEARLNSRAIGEGLDLTEPVRQMVESDLARKEVEALKTPEGHWDFVRFRALPKADQTRILERAAQEAAPLYAADLALPAHERELTAFESLNDYDPIYDSPEDYLLSDGDSTNDTIEKVNHAHGEWPEARRNMAH